MKKNFLITCGIVVLVVGGLWGGYAYLWLNQIAPLLDRFSATQGNIQRVVDQNDEYRRRIEPDLQQNAEEYGNIKNLFFVADIDHSLDFIKFIEEVAKRNSLISTINTAPQASALSAQITVSGAFPNVVRFIREVENDRLLVRISSVSMQLQGNVSASMSLSLQSL